MPIEPSFPPVVWDKPPVPVHVGLALGGGAARGMAHVGVLLALEEHRIPVHAIAGVSAGALAGGLIAAGISATRLRELVRNLGWMTISTLPRPHFSLNVSNLAAIGLPLGFLDLDRLIEWIDQTTGESLRFDQLNIPFAAIATDIVSGEMVVMNDGLIAPAIRASCSVPGVFTPARRNGRLLVDGGAINNLPVAVVRRLGAEYVIGVDLLPFPNQSHKEPGNILELSITALYSLIRTTQADDPPADCTIQPDIAHFSFADLSAADELIDAGYTAASAAIPKIRHDLGLD
jgi:NTE family protein